MATIQLAAPNLAQYVTAIGGGDWTAELPVSQLLEPTLQHFARTASLAPAATQFHFTLDRARPISIVGLINHNMSTAAQFRITLSADGVSPVWDSGLQDVWPALYATEDLLWEDEQWWDGRILQEDRVGYPSNVIAGPDYSVAVQYGTVELIDAGNTAPYVQAGRLFLGAGWSPAYNKDYGSQIGWAARSESQEARSGTRFVDVLPDRRFVKFTLANLADAEALGPVLEMQRRVSTHGEVLYRDDPADTSHQVRTSFLATFRDLSPIQSVSPNRRTAEFYLEEIL